MLIRPCMLAIAIAATPMEALAAGLASRPRSLNSHRHSSGQIG